MEDVSRLKINDNTYNIKDSIARKGVETAQSLANTANSTANSAKSTANRALTSANNAVTRLDELNAEYNASTETINFNINV